MEQLLQTRATAGRRRTLAASAAFAFLALMLFFPARGSAEQADPAGDLPLTFAPNAGQTDDSVRYVARGAGYSFFFADEQAVLSLIKADGQDVSGLATPGVFDRGYNNTDVFVTKLDSSGSTIAYSTFIGGSAFDSGNGIAVDDAGAAYVAGFSGVAELPDDGRGIRHEPERRQ